MFDILLWLALPGVAIAGLAATGAKLLDEFSRHDLEPGQGVRACSGER